MKVSVEQKPGQEITLTNSVTWVAGPGWNTMITIPHGVKGKLRHFQLTADIVGTAWWNELRVLRGAVTIWSIYDSANQATTTLVPRHYDCNVDVLPGDLVQMEGSGTPSFAVYVSCVATIFPPAISDRFFDDESYPICGLKDVDQGRPDLVRLAAVNNLLTYMADPINLEGAPPVKKT